MVVDGSEGVASERDADRAWPHRVIRRGAAVRPLPPHARSLADLNFEAGGVRVGLDDFMARRRTAGILVLKDGEIALERYGLTHGPARRWHGFSTTKSITATLAGAAFHDGAIASLDDRCGRYLPQLSGSAYADVTIRNVLRMCSGVAWAEEFVPEERSDVPRLNDALRTRRPGAVLDLARTLPRAHPQGAVFNYSTVESCVLAAVIAAATGRPLADYCAERIWGPAGMEADASWALDGEDGLEMGGFGVSARLRDVGRFGLLVLEDGVAFDGRRVTPPGWRDLAGQPDCAATAFGALTPGDPGGYGYQWWVVPPRPGGVNNGAFSAIGAHGHWIFVNPAERVVIAIQSAWRQSHDVDGSIETAELIRAAVRALQTEGTS